MRAARIRAAGQRAADTAEVAQRQAKQVTSSSPEPDSDKVNLPSFVGMLRSGHGGLAARAKEIVRGTDVK